MTSILTEHHIEVIDQLRSGIPGFNCQVDTDIMCNTTIYFSHENITRGLCKFSVTIPREYGGRIQHEDQDMIDLLDIKDPSMFISIDCMIRQSSFTRTFSVRMRNESIVNAEELLDEIYYALSIEVRHIDRTYEIGNFIVYEQMSFKRDDGGFSGI